MLNKIKKAIKGATGPTIRRISPMMGEYLSKIGEVRKFRDGYTPMEKEKKDRPYYKEIEDDITRDKKREAKIKKQEELRAAAQEKMKNCDHFFEPAEREVVKNNRTYKEKYSKCYKCNAEKSISGALK